MLLVLRGTAQEDSATFFLFWDFVALWAAILTFVAMEDGHAAACCVILAAPVVSPGAAFTLYLGHVREPRVASYIMAATDKTR
jgi:hypothetical protein